MAQEIERLVATLSADINRFEKQLAKAGQIANRELGGVEKRGALFADNMNTAMAGAARGFEATGRNANVLKGQTANLAAQFQDIAVQLQSGTSPLTIALQQGTQISAALGPMGAGGAVKALGGAFLSLLNPVSLAVIAIIGAGGAAVQYFSSVLSEGEKSNAKIKEQEQLIRAVAERWGDAVPSLQAYVDQLKRAKDIEDLGAVTQSRIDEELANARAQLPGVLEQVYQLKIGLLSLGPEAGPAIDAITAAFEVLERNIANGSVTVDDYRAAQEAVNQAQNLGVLAAGALAGVLTKLEGAWGGAIAGARKYAAEARNAISLQPDNLFLDPMQKMQVQGKKPTGAVAYDVTPKTWYKPTGGQSAKSDATREREQAAEAAKREAEAVQELIDNLVFEASLVGMNAAEKAAANAVRRAGAAATDEERQFIEAATIALEQQKDAIEANKAAMQDMQDMTKGFLTDFFSGIEQGKSVWESFGNAALNVLDKITNKLLDDVLNAIFDVNGALAGGGKGGGFLSLLGSLFGGGGASPAISSIIAAGGGGLFSSGGYTGAGSKNQIAGAVHAGEFVFSKEAVNRLGLGNLSALHAMGKAGFAGGGLVGSIPSAVSTGRAGVSTPGSVSYHIDARGAVEGTAEQIRKALTDYDRKVAPRTARNAVREGQHFGVSR